jgi:hypothetical protein
MKTYKTLSVLAAAAALVAGVVLIPLSAAPAPKTRPASLTIFGGDAGARVLDDAGQRINAVYADFSLAPPASNEVCVHGYVESPGNVHMRLNRRLLWNDAYENIKWCHERPLDAPGQYVDRTYTLLISDQTACEAELQLSYGLDTHDASLQHCDVRPEPYSAPAGYHQPHVRGATVFKGKATRSPISFGFSVAGRSYQVNTVGDVPFTLNSANSKELTWSGDAVLGEVGGSATYTFPLPFKLRFERF